MAYTRTKLKVMPKGLTSNARLVFRGILGDSPLDQQSVKVMQQCITIGKTGFWMIFPVFHEAMMLEREGFSPSLSLSAPMNYAHSFVSEWEAGQHLESLGSLLKMLKEAFKRFHLLEMLGVF